MRGRSQNIDFSSKWRFLLLSYDSADCTSHSIMRLPVACSYKGALAPGFVEVSLLPFSFWKESDLVDSLVLASLPTTSDALANLGPTRSIFILTFCAEFGFPPGMKITNPWIFVTPSPRCDSPVI